ncbi:MAG: hypothetical protein ACYTEE_07705, partial [Planctomycetota bacterium]
DTNSATVTILPLPVPSIDPCDVDICEGDEHEFCVEVTGGTAPYSYQWIKMPSTLVGTDDECFTATEAGEYCVVVTDDNGCSDFACATLTIIPDPPCDIEGPDPVCEMDVNEYCGPPDVDSWLWEVISGDASIVGPNDEECVDVNTGTTGFTLKLTTTNENDVICSSECELPVDVEPCDDVNGCTPGFWKNNAAKWEANAWVNYDPTDKFETVFDVDVTLRVGKKRNTVGNPSLLQALRAKGGCENALARHAVAALLNINGGCGAYPMDESTLKSKVKTALDSGKCPDIRTLKNELVEYNEEGCAINMQGECMLDD